MCVCTQTHTHTLQGAYYPGKIRSVKKKGLQYAYAVQFDDGDFDASVPEEHVKGRPLL